MNADGADRGRAGRSAPAWLLDRAFAIRPLLWIPAVAVYGAGRAWEFREAGREGFRPGPLAALLLILAAVHAANAWRDRDGDRLNRKSLPVGRGRGGGRSLLALILGSILAAVLLTRGASITEQALLLASLVLGVAYVAPPLEIKRRPLLDLLAHGAGYGILAFLLGAAGSGGPDAVGGVGGMGGLPHESIAALPYGLGIMTVSLLTMLADRDGDERMGQTGAGAGAARRRDLARRRYGSLQPMALGIRLPAAGGRWGRRLIQRRTRE